MSNVKIWKRELTELGQEFGCRLEETKGSHLVLIHPDGWRVFTSKSPSDRRALQYVKSDLKRKASGVWK